MNLTWNFTFLIGESQLVQIKPSSPDPGRREKINLNFFFTLLCGASKGFILIQLSEMHGAGRVKSFYATGLFLYPLTTSENLWFSDVFRGCRLIQQD